MARRRVNTSPNISSHRAGCTVRVSISVGSWRSLRTSHSAMVNIFLEKLPKLASGETWRGCVNAIALSKSLCCAAGSCSFTETSSRFQGIACIMDEYIVEGCVRHFNRSLQVIRRVGETESGKRLSSTAPMRLERDIVRIGKEPRLLVGCRRAASRESGRYIANTAAPITFWVDDMESRHTCTARCGRQ